jgi:hypothetical protein
MAYAGVLTRELEYPDPIDREGIESSILGSL